MNYLKSVYALPALFLLSSTVAADPMFDEILRSKKPNVSIKSIKPATKAQMIEIRNMMERELKDASSAQYRDVMVAKDAEGIQYACGKINAKNSYGGYVGFTRFVSIGMMGAIFEDITPKGDRVFQLVNWEAYCVKT